MAEQVDAAPSKGVAARRGGSNPSARTNAAQNIHDWNTAIFAEARRKSEEAFDALLSERNNRERRQDMPTLF
jgi:hypothetical protein